jgi:ribosome biogenesis GTPase
VLIRRHFVSKCVVVRCLLTVFCFSGHRLEWQRRQPGAPSLAQSQYLGDEVESHQSLSVENQALSKNPNFDAGSFKDKPKPPNWEKDNNRRKFQKAVKKVKPNRDVRPPRRKNWLSDSDLGEDEFTTYERVMPRGERERQRAVLSMAEQIVVPDEPILAGAVSGLRGVVTEVSTGLCRVDLDGRTLLCTLRGSLSAQDTGYTNVIAVGDAVLVTASGQDSGVVEQVLPRRSVLARPDVFYNHLQQVIVANVDQLLIVASWREPHIWLELIDRYLITAGRANLTPIICVNKIDLAEDRQECLGLLKPYQNMNLLIVFTSAHTGEGIDTLRTLLQDRATVLAGLSGVGKSSLLSAVQPGLNLRTREVSEVSRQGQHTTTQALMLRLGDKGFVVDTPGIREFGLSGLHQSELANFYPEIVALAGSCRFSNCAHIHEPGCAVREAAEQGKLAAWRYHNYRKIFETLSA